jgi:hypothetical protein
MYSEYSHLVYAVNAPTLTRSSSTERCHGDRRLLTIDVNEVMERVLRIAERVRRSMAK